jgi:ParB-like chromosome segregation protein Spo0J
MTKTKEETEYKTIQMLKINPEYSNMVNPLSELEYQSLKYSISKKGLHLPIIVNQDGVILDGHHRYRICKELGIESVTEVKRFDNLLDEKEFVIEINLKRRHLNNFQIAELEYKMEEIYKERAKMRSFSNLKNVNKEIILSTAPNDAIDVNIETGKVSELIAKKTGLSPRTYERAKKIIEEGSEKVKEKLRANKTTISKEYDKIQRDLKRQGLLSQINNLQSNSNSLENDNYKLVYGDFIEQSQKEIADSSIDLIFTDPPYSQEFLCLYEDLARLAVRVLKPRGSLVTYVGNISLTEIIKIFDSQQPGLKFWWQFVVKHNGGHQRIHARNVFARYKSLLWYVKGEKPNELVVSNNISDVIESSPSSKILHDWEQSPIEPEYVIKNLTLENHSIVLDPMMGLGTTGVSSILLNRKFIGIEKNKDTFKIAQSRITKEELAKKE